MRRLQIDLNSRARGGLSPAPYLPEHSTPAVGEQVLVYEPEDAVVADGVVVDVDTDRRVAYIAVDWGSLRDDEPSTTAAFSYSWAGEVRESVRSNVAVAVTTHFDPGTRATDMLLTA